MATAVAVSTLTIAQAATAAPPATQACGGACTQGTPSDCTGFACGSRAGAEWGRSPSIGARSQTPCGDACADTIADAPLPLLGDDPWWLVVAWAILAVFFPIVVLWQRQRIRALAGTVSPALYLVEGTSRPGDPRLPQDRPSAYPH